MRDAICRIALVVGALWIGARDVEASAPSPPARSETKPPRRSISPFRDLRFERGFLLGFPHASHGRAVEAVLSTNASSTDPERRPVWRLCQWGTRHSLAGASTERVDGGQVRWANASKEVVCGGAMADDGDLRLTLRSTQEYGERPRRAGEAWPHLLVEQDASRVIPLDRLDSVRLRVALRLRSFRDGMAGHADPSLHAAQLQLFLIVKNVAPDDPARGEYLWFGCPFFDCRHEYPPAHRAKDAGKDDATGRFIYTLDGRRILPGPMAVGRWVSVDAELLPDIRKALREAKRRGFLTSDDPARFAVVNMNLGWEMPGTYDASAEVRNLDVSVVPRRAGAAPAEAGRSPRGERLPAVCRLTPLHVGRCRLGADHVFGGNRTAEERVDFAIYSFLVEGPGGERALVDLGPETLGYANEMFRRYGFFRDRGAGAAAAGRYPDDLTQPHGNVFGQLARLGVPRDAIGHIVLSHLHADHHGIDDATDGGACERFPEAVFHVSRRGWRQNLALRGEDGRWGSYVDHAFSDFLLRREREGRVRFEDDAEVFPGLRTLHLGGHSPCSQAAVVRTAAGTVVFASDDVYLYALLEEGIVPAIRVGEREWREAVGRILEIVEREDAILIPSHDPLVWEIWRRHGGRWLEELRAVTRRAVEGYRRAGSGE